MSPTHSWLCFIAFGDLEREVTRASIDDLKEFPRCKSTMQRNLFYSLFKAISDTIAARPAHVERTTSHNCDKTPNSEVSSESNEDKREEFSRVMFTKTHRPYSWPHQLSRCRVRRLHVSHNIVCFSPPLEPDITRNTDKCRLASYTCTRGMEAYWYDVTKANMEITSA